MERLWEQQNKCACVVAGPQGFEPRTNGDVSRKSFFFFNWTTSVRIAYHSFFFHEWLVDELSSVKSVIYVLQVILKPKEPAYVAVVS
jgi:hypothetical protein